jgi:glycosyltransferase involved in cell wall biosynthesis
MTRVLVVHNRYRSRFASGENRVVDQEMDLLRSGGHEVATYLRTSDEIAGSGPLERLRLPARVVWSADDRRAIRRLAARERPDIVHVHNTFPLISPSVIHAAAELGIPVVLTLHNYRLFCANGALFRDGRPCESCLGSSPLPGLWHGCYRGSRLTTAPLTVSISTHRRLRTWDRVAFFIALSRFARDKVVAGGLPADRVVVKPNFVPRPKPFHRNEPQHFLFIGRLSEEKGADLLVTAWSSRFGRLVVAGEGPQRSALERRARAADDSIRFVGHRSPDACAALLHSARAVVVPSKAYEGFPVVVAEAFAHGVPVVAPAHGPFEEIVRDGSNGLLFRPGDPTDLAERLLRLLDPRRAREMGDAAHGTYEARYTPERNLTELEAIYRQAIADGTPSNRAAAPRATRSGPRVEVGG